MRFLLSGVLGYLLGSIPTAYLLVRWTSGADIRRAGSGNVGTLNSYLVTKSRLVGASVLIVDVLKGAASVIVAGAVAGREFATLGLAGAMAVLGHNFPVWLGFRGGRGLATAAGVMAVLGWLFVALWGIWWGAGFLIFRRVNVGNAFACALTLVTALVLPQSSIRVMVTADPPMSEFRIFLIVFLSVILIKHVGPVGEYLRERRATE